MPLTEDRAAIAAAATTSAIARAAIATAAAATTVSVLINPFAVKRRNKVAREQESGSTAGKAGCRGATGSAAVAGIDAVGRIAAPLPVVDVATATATAHQVSSCLSQGFQRTKRKQRTRDVSSAIAIAATIAGQASAGATADRNRTAYGRQNNAQAQKEKQLTHDGLPPAIDGSSPTGITSGVSHRQTT